MYMLKTKMGKESLRRVDQIMFSMLHPIMANLENPDPNISFPQFPYAKHITQLGEGRGWNMGNTPFPSDLNKAGTSFILTPGYQNRSFPEPSKVSAQLVVKANSRLLTRPVMYDYSKSSQSLTGSDDMIKQLACSADDIASFLSSPLTPLKLDGEHVVKMSAQQDGDILAAELPFQVPDVAIARTTMAKNMILRMQNDMKTSAELLGKTQYFLKYLSPVHIHKLQREAESVADAAAFSNDLPDPTSLARQATSTFSSDNINVLAHALTQLQELHERLSTFRASETKLLNESTELVRTLANHVTDAKADELCFQLLRFTGQRVVIWWELIAAGYLSSTQVQDLLLLNPHFDDSKIEDFNFSVSLIMFRSVRLMQINRCAVSVLNLIEKIQKFLLVKLMENWRGRDDLNTKPTVEMATFALQQANYSESKALDVLQRMLEFENKQLSGQNIEQRDLVRTVYHQSNFDEALTLSTLKDPELPMNLLHLSRRGCYYNGKKLYCPPLAEDPSEEVVTDPTEEVKVTVGLAADADENNPLLAMVHVLQHTSDALAKNLTASRGYCKDANFDPRFLVFEYVSGLMLRPRQVQLVNDFLNAHQNGVSSVHQMIMGAGKTTVIAPLLSLMLAQGKSLVTQVVPKALLPMSRSVLRNVFTNVVNKRVLTVKFDRSHNNVGALRKLYVKLNRARSHGDVIVMTPESVKSMYLKYIELLISEEHASPVLFVPVTRLGAQRDKALVMADALRANSQMADEMQKILHLWSKAAGGTALLDEVDLVLHPLRSELNFPIGEKEPVDLGSLRWNFPIHLLDAVFYTQSGRISIVDFRPDSEAVSVLSGLSKAVERGLASLSLQLTPHLVLLNDSFYETDLKPLFARWAVVWLLLQNSITTDIESTITKSKSGSASVLDEEAKNLNPPKLAKKTSYTGPSGNGYAREQVQKNILDFVLQNECEDAKAMLRAHFSVQGLKLLNLARDWIQSFLPHVLSKVNRVSYGLLHEVDTKRWAAQEPGEFHMPKSRELLAIPFVGKDVPSRSSEFAHPEVLIGLSILGYRYEGLRKSNLKLCVVKLKEDMLNEPGPYSERPSRILFQDWLNLAHLHQLKEDEEDHDIVPLELFQANDPKQMSTLHTVLSGLPETVLFFLNTHVFTRVMRFQHRKLTATGVDLGGDQLFGSRLGFSGTPSDLLPKELRPCHYERGSEASIIRVLSSAEFVSATNIPKGWTVNSLLENVATHQPPFSALIDTGALITGLTNEQVARHLLKHGLATMEACVFLNEEDQKMVVDRSGGKPVALSRSGVSVEKRFTFYDQIHTTGMDIKQGIDAKAAVTIGKDMTLRDYAQGCYRMRGLGKGQTLSVLLVPEVVELVNTWTQGRSKQSKSDALPGPPALKRQDSLRAVSVVLASVVSWLVKKSMESENLQHVALSKHQLQAVWRRKAFQELMDSRCPSEKKTHSSAMVSRFHEPITDEAKIMAVLNEYSVLSKADRDKAAKKKRMKEVREKLDKIVKLVKKKSNLDLDVRTIVRQVGGNMEKALESLVEVATQWGVDLADLDKTDLEVPFDYATPFNCSICTFRNPGGKKCSVCDSPRDVEAEKAAVEAEKQRLKEQREVQLALTRYSMDVNIYMMTSNDGEYMELDSTDINVDSKDDTVGSLIPILQKEALISAMLSSQDTLQVEVRLDGEALPTNSRIADYPAMVGDEASCDVYLVQKSGVDAKIVSDAKTTAVAEQLYHLPESATDRQRLRYAIALSNLPQFDEEDLESSHSQLMALNPIKWLRECVKLFEEELELLTVQGEVPSHDSFSHSLAKEIKEHAAFLSDPESRKAAADILEQVKLEEQDVANSDSGNQVNYDSEMVQQQEQEQEQQKHVQDVTTPDMNFFRNFSSTPWPVTALSMKDGAAALLPVMFYPLRKFCVTGNNKSVSLPFPDSVLLSENFAPSLHRSDLPRRLKNVNVVMEWQHDRVDFGYEDHEIIANVGESKSSRIVSTVALSLAEAETLRRVVQLRAGSLDVGLLASNGLWLGAPRPVRDVPESKLLVEQKGNSVGLQCLRFFDCQMWFDEHEIILLLRAVSLAAESMRRQYFDQIIGARRRDRVSWENTSVALLFAHKDEKHLQKLRDESIKIREAIAQTHPSLLAAFNAFDLNQDGWLSPNELVVAFNGLNLGLSDADIAELLEHADQNHDGFLNYREFAAQFSANDEDELLSNEQLVLKRSLSSKGVMKDRKTGGILESIQSLAKSTQQKLYSSNASDAKKKAKDHRLRSYAQLQTLGSLFLRSGGGAVFYADNKVKTRPGYRVTLCGRGVQLTNGSFYYEVTIEKPGRACIGFGDHLFTPNFFTGLGVGDDDHSFGFDGFSADEKTVEGNLRSNGKKGRSYGQVWRAGDVIGCAVSIHSDDSVASVRFSVNGIDCGEAWNAIPFTHGLSPSVSFDTSFVFAVNFGDHPFRYAAPKHHRSIRYWVRKRLELFHAVNSAATYGKLMATTGDAQITIEETKQGSFILTVDQHFPSAVLQGCLLTSGRWYYEFTIKRNGVAQVGYCDLDFVGSTRDGVGVGDDKHSWGVDLYRSKLWHNGQIDYGGLWQVGDVIGCCVDVDMKTISFSQNGSFNYPMGVAMKNINFVGGLTPGITLNPCSLEVNFGKVPFVHKPSGYNSIESWLVAHDPKKPAKTDATLLPALQLERSVSLRTKPIVERTGVEMRTSSGHAVATINPQTLVVGSTGGYPTIVANDIVIRSGKWYFEVRVTKLSIHEDTRCAIGYAEPHAVFDYVKNTGVNDSNVDDSKRKTSWGVGTQAGGHSLESSQRNAFLQTWKLTRDDVIAVCLDADNHTVSYYATRMGKGDIPNNAVPIAILADCNASSDAYVPAISVTEGVELQVSFGASPTVHAPEGFTPIHVWFMSSIELLKKKAILNHAISTFNTP